MRFSIINTILGWQAWKKPTYRRSIRGRQSSNRKPRPHLPRRNLQRMRRTRKLMKRQRYKSPDQLKTSLRHRLIQIGFVVCYAWIIYEVVMSSLLLE